MTAFTIQTHSAMDKFPAFLSTIRAEFPDDCEAIADEIIDAELGDFCWDSRVAERIIGTVESGDGDDEEAHSEVRIVGYFRGRYLVATCILDAKHRPIWMPKVRYFDLESDADCAFLAAS
jgi:hypothetical protein